MSKELQLVKTHYKQLHDKYGEVLQSWRNSVNSWKASLQTSSRHVSLENLNVKCRALKNWDHFLKFLFKKKHALSCASEALEERKNATKLREDKEKAEHNLVTVP